MEATEIFQQLERALGDRHLISPERLSQVFLKSSEVETKRLNEYYENNPREAQFLGLLESKPSMSEPEYRQRFEELTAAYPELKDDLEQNKIFEAVRSVTPEGSLIKLENGYAIPRSERRSGRSPKGTFPVHYPELEEIVDFEHTKGSVSEQDFLEALGQVMDYMKEQELYSIERQVGQGNISIPVSVISEKPSQIAFAANMFRALEETEREYSGWLILSAPCFTHHDKNRFPDGVIKFFDYRRKIILIAGTGYNGEIKKGMFTVANHELPLKGHLSFHCSSVFDPKSNSVTLVFGLSGTGKSTVASGLAEGQMLSDDETVLDLGNKRTFNIENGNYYKTGGLLNEPRVLDALKKTVSDHHPIYENIVVGPAGTVIFAADPTENGRVSVTLTALEGAIPSGSYPLPDKIIILSRDVNAILDPVNILSTEQIVYYLNLGYTSKTPGTEAGVTKPVPTFSKWEGGPFYDLKDEIIMKTLLEYLGENEVQGILLNSGEGGGPYGSSHNSRFPVELTLKISMSFMDGRLSKLKDQVPDSFEPNEKLGTSRPLTVPGIPIEFEKYLNSEKVWRDNGFKDEYQKESKELYEEFSRRAGKSLAGKDNSRLEKILAAGPVVAVS